MRQQIDSIERLKQYSKIWFGQGNKRFFGDFSYTLQFSDKGTPFLVQGTYKWSDGFNHNQPKQKFYRVIPIQFDEDGKIKALHGVEEFSTLRQAKAFIKGLE